MPQGPLAAAVFQKFTNALGFSRIDQQQAQWDTARHGKYYAGVYGTPAILTGNPPVVTTQAKAGQTYCGANQSSATLSAALATTYTGLCLSNPAASGLNLSVKKVGGIVTNAPGGLLGLGLITGWLAAGITVHTTPLNTSILNAYVGAAAANGSVLGAASIANLDAACTLVGTPTWAEWITANVATTNSPSFDIDLDESLIIPPGGYVAIGGTASQGGFFGSFMWEEIAP